MKNLKTLVIFIGASFMLLVGILLCVNEQEIIKLNSRLERLERYTYNKESIVFLGDSITSRCDLDKYFPNYNVYNSGIAGNMTKDILDNMENRVFVYNPTKVFILIGTNDLVYSGLDNDGIKNNIEEILSDDTIDGAVVTHGTDTLDETAYFLTLTLNTPKPVVLTGAMRPATATSADGPFNLYQAICLACHGESYNRGVLALFSNTIYSGRDIEKVNNFKIDAFDQRSLGCLGYMQDQEVYFYTQTSKIHTIKSRFNKRIDSIKSVAIAFYYSGADAKILYDLASDHEGIVIAGSGSGNYSQAWLKAIEELSEKGTIFVRSSRISQGIVFDDEIFDPHHLCISSNTLSPQKARVLLMLALTQTHDRDEIKEIFLQY